MNFEHIISILQLSIGPVIVISGVGLVLLSMTNRYGRVIDRSRILAELFRDTSHEHIHRLRTQLRILMKRAKILRLAILFASFSLLLAAFLIIALFLMAFFKMATSVFIVWFFMLCMFCLIIGLVYFIVDINVSLSALKIETDID